MTPKTQTLVRQYARAGHPLGRPIDPKEVAELVTALRRRLECTSQELDLSPPSLARLESRLIALHCSIQAGHTQMDEVDTVRLMREITAYLGQVLVTNLGAQWEAESISLWPSMLWVAMPIEVVKGREVHVSSTRGFVAADNATYFWDLIGTGKEKGFLQREYKMMTRRRWTEGL
jgi:hypothetical protein